MENDKVINKMLADRYGKDYAGFPHYRIAQNSRSNTEKRVGTKYFRHGNAIIAETTDVFEFPRYSYIPEGLWILENLCYNNENVELVEKQSYEPLFVFYDKDGEYVKPNFKMCEYIIETVRQGPGPKLSEEEQNAKIVQRNFEMLGGKATNDGSIADGSGVSYAGLDAKKES